MGATLFASLFIISVATAKNGEVLSPTRLLTKENQTHAIAQDFINKKNELEAADLKSRQVMATIYKINQRMKFMSKKRDSLNNKMIDAEGGVRSLARSILEVESKIAKQREQLRGRLKMIYMMGDDGVAKIIFSSLSAQDLDQSLKYLKLISDNDYRLIKSYEKNKFVLSQAHDKLKIEVKKMIGIKEKLKNQEMLLNRDQMAKTHILRALKTEREGVLQSLTAIRNEADKKNLHNFLDLSFYEKKGHLQEPVSGRLVTDFSMIESEEFRYRLSHKGFRYKTAPESAVRAVFTGNISFVGAINGYGQTIVIDHSDHYYSVYANASRVLVREGQSVKTNDIIAKTEDSLYFEIRHFSDAIDPKPWLQQTQ